MTKDEVIEIFESGEFIDELARTLARADINNPYQAHDFIAYINDDGSFKIYYEEVGSYGYYDCEGEKYYLTCQKGSCDDLYFDFFVGDFDLDDYASTTGKTVEELTEIVVDYIKVEDLDDADPTDAEVIFYALDNDSECSEKMFEEFVSIGYPEEALWIVENVIKDLDDEEPYDYDED